MPAYFLNRGRMDLSRLYLGDATRGRLGEDAEVIAQSVLVELLKFDLVSGLEVESFAGEPIIGINPAKS
jgi:hypothetical protein